MNIQDLFEPLWNVSDQAPKKNTGKEGNWINVGHKMGIFSPFHACLRILSIRQKEFFPCPT